MTLVRLNGINRFPLSCDRSQLVTTDTFFFQRNKEETYSEKVVNLSGNRKASVLLVCFE